MTRPQDCRLTLARMEVAQAETQRRPRGRSASSSTSADERLFQQHLAELALARRGEIDALIGKLERQETAITEFQSRNRVSAAGQ